MMNEVEQEVELNTTLDLVNSLQVDNFSDAKSMFTDILGSKVQDALDAEKVSVADQIFNGVEAEDLEVTDEEIYAELDEFESEAE